MVHQSCSYLKLKGSTYYFSRRVPKPLQKHFKTDRVEVCLHTPQQSSAVRQAQVLASELEDHWYILRRREIKHRLSSVFGDGSHDMRHTASVTGVGPQLSAALEVYLSLKGAGRPKTFESPIAYTHLVLNCRCGHVGQIAVSDLPAQMSEADNIFVAHYLALSDLLGV